jgi:hypothetical protein
MSGREWTKREDQFLRKHYGKQCAKWLSDKLDRSSKSIYQRAHTLSLQQPQQPDYWQKVDSIFFAVIKEYHPQGYTDREMAEIVLDAINSCNERRDHNVTHTLASLRRRMTDRRRDLGLSHNAYSARRRAQVAAKTREQCKQAGVASLAEVRRKVYSEWKASHGWPDSLTVRAVQAAELFVQHGAMTRAELCLRMGYSPKKRINPPSNAPGGTVLAELARHGIVSRVNKAIRVPFDLQLHDDQLGNRPRISDRKIQWKRISLYIINPEVAQWAATRSKSKPAS